MIRSVLSRVSLSVCLALATPFVAVACSSDGGGSGEQSQTGSLALPLVTHVGDSTYRLSASIYVYGPTFTVLYTSADPSEEVLTATLQTGDYQAYLSDYQLEKLDSSGNFVPVSATLVSSYSVDFTIYNRSTTSISFEFETDGVIVPVGAGNLNVHVGITETSPACNILGDDCGAGAWCPPPELTARPLACQFAGSVAVGEACEGPLDCVGNASCFDFGGGPVCANLCPKSDFGAACAGGGSCEEAGAEYGICVPEGGTFPTTGSGGSGGGGFGGMGGFAGKGGDVGAGGAAGSAGSPF